MQIDLKDKVVVVTGGFRGIGRAITEFCARAGATVLATFVTSEKAAQDDVGRLQAEGLNVTGYRVDVRESIHVESFFAMIESEYGKLDVLVNNAGVVRDNLLLGMNDDEWHDVLDTNLNGTFYVTRAAAKLMIRKRRGNVVNISSVAASKPGRGQCNYAASKGGIEAMTKALAVELGGKGIRVNCVAPGVIETDMSKDVRDAAGDQILESIILRRYGAPQDVANAVVFLASDASSYITGEVLHIDGGLKS